MIYFRNIKNEENILFYIFSIIGIISCIYLKSNITIVLVILFCICNSEVIYFYIIFIPIVDVLSIVVVGHTIDQSIALIYIIIFFIRLFRNKINIILNKFSFNLFLYIIIIIFGILNVLIFEDYIGFNNFNYSSLISENIYRLGKIFFALILFFDFANKSKEEIQNLIKKISISVTISLIIVYIYSFLNPRQDYYYIIDAFRITLKGTNPSEFPMLCSSLLVFPFYVLFCKNQKRIFKVLAIISIISVIRIVLLTISKGGFFTLLFCLLMVYLYLIGNSKKRLLASILFIGLIILIVITNKPLVNNIEKRILLTSNSLSSFSTLRTDFWEKGIINTFNNKLLFGYGSTIIAEKKLNMIAFNRPAVMHSIYIGIFVQYGLLGLILFLKIIYPIIYLNFFKKKYYKNIGFLIIIPINLSVLLFGGLFLGWAFRELLWVSIGINLGMIYSISKSSTS